MTLSTIRSALFFAVLLVLAEPSAISAQSASNVPNSPVFTLAGLTLGSPLGDAPITHTGVSEHPGSRGTLWTWKRPEGGNVGVYTDAKGLITSIDFTADEGEKGTIDLPCAEGFDIQSSHVNLEFAIDPKICVPGSIGLYELPDQSILNVSFDGPGDGQLHEAVWYRPLN